MKDYQESFLKLAIKSKSLQFGEFTLMSGRSCPFFFNAANMLSSCSLYELAKCYVDAIEDKNLNFDCIYGPAYKGIFLGSIVATLFSEQGNNYPLAFNRKEEKENGTLCTIRITSSCCQRNRSDWRRAKCPVDYRRNCYKIAMGSSR